MLKGRSIIYALVGATCLALLLSLLAVINAQNQGGQKSAQPGNLANAQHVGKALDDEATPIVDFDNPNTNEPGSSRKLKNALHNREAFVLNDPQRVGEVIREEEWQSGLSDLPADKSDLVVEGEVTGAEAFLSDDKTGIYSEFTIRVSKILKAAPALSINPDATIVTERVGGRVRYPSGKIVRHRIEGQGSPVLGRKYLFFLAKAEQENYRLLTAYEIQGGQVFALDGLRVVRRGQGAWRFDKHNGQDFGKFMEEVNRAINNSQSGRN